MLMHTYTLLYTIFNKLLDILYVSDQGTPCTSLPNFLCFEEFFGKLNCGLLFGQFLLLPTQTT